MADLEGLKNETAEVLLNSIKERARQEHTRGLVELANAYAAVVSTHPRPSS